MRAPRIALLLPLLTVTCTGGEAMDLPRDLSQVRFDQLPEDLPQAWRTQLEAELAGAPRMSLLDPRAVEAARDLLLRVTWIDPESIAVRSALPDGLQVDFRPRTPRLAVTRNGSLAGVVSADGAVLPGGLPAAWTERYLSVPLDETRALGAPGSKVADSLLQEALAVWQEADFLRDRVGLQVASIERQSGYPREAAGVPPALSFRLADGREIAWGRAASSRDPFGVPLARKMERLRRVLEVYPDLAGVDRLVLDYPDLKLYDPKGEAIPLPATLRDL